MLGRLGFARKFWHSWVSQALFLIIVISGLALLIAGVWLALDTSWVEAVAAFVTGGELVVVAFSIGSSIVNRPATILCTSQDDINNFMRKFISEGSTALVASYNLSWVKQDTTVEDFLKDQVKNGKAITIFVGATDNVSKRLAKAGIIIREYATTGEDKPRFTLLNMGREGSEKLAVAREGLPTHWIDVYTSKYQPQILAVAKAYVRQLGTE